ncbi:MAG: GGDEF domain-containing protein [Clostridia bacterium]|nr:GGDEF domain-containing protein [Clostridia bacterium]
MRSLRTRITFMTVGVVLLAVSIVTVTSVFFIRSNEHRKSDQLLLLLCETGEKNLDYYFNSVQKSVGKVASFVEADLDGVEEEQLARHMNRVGKYFDEMAAKTNGVLTYYYRIDPILSDKVKGFWYTNLDGEGFVEHKVTDITRYDTEDTSQLVWFTVPKYEGKAIWLPPYITDNLDKRVISYNEPIYWKGQFVGVVGIEIDYTTMAEQVDSIRLYSNGYAFLSDADGNLFYHPRLDVTKLSEDEMPTIPKGLVSESTFIRYEFEGVEKEAAWLPLSNGMRLNVTTPVSEAEGDWQQLIWNILIVAAGVLAVSTAIALLYSRRIVRPLTQLTEAAEQADQGNYDYELSYDKDDEVGRLTKTFRRMSNNMKEHIDDLSNRVYIDALTHIKNKGAFATTVEQMQSQQDDADLQLDFAIGIFDCNNLKQINDTYGHEKGDIYLQTASQAICRVFQHSPVFRIGGDEFAVILRGEDYVNRELLIRRFEDNTQKRNAAVENDWEKVDLAMGIADYDPVHDQSVNDVIRRADKMMYEHKRGTLPVQ